MCCGRLSGFCNNFLYISLSASIYSKVPKQSRVCRYLSTKLCCKILFGEKKHCNKLLLFWFFKKWGQYDPMVLLINFFHGTRAGLNILMHSLYD